MIVTREVKRSVTSVCSTGPRKISRDHEIKLNAFIHRLGQDLQAPTESFYQARQLLELGVLYYLPDRPFPVNL